MLGKRSFALFALLYILSRTAFHLAGLRFCPDHVPSMMHFVDLELLEDRLLETLFYLHSQPPLMSLIMGVLLKVFGDQYPIAMQALFLSLGLSVGYIVIDMIKRLQYNAIVGLILALFITHLPGFIVYENYWFFTFPLLWLLLASSRYLLMALDEGHFISWFKFFSALATLVLFKNLFHMGWMFLAFLLARWGMSKERRRKVMLGFTFPFLLVMGLYAKNAIVFGRFEASSWLGFGLARKTYHQFPIEARVEWAMSGLLHPVVALPIYGSVAEFEQAFTPSIPCGVPLLDRPQKANGWINYHHDIYRHACAKMAAESFKIIKEQPSIYFDNVRQTLGRLFIPSTVWEPVSTPYGQARAYCDAVDGIFFAPLLGLTPWAFIAVIVIFGTPIAFLIQRKRGKTSERFVLVYMVGTMVYVWGLAVFFDTHETPRYRLMTDGLLVMSVPLLIKCFRSKPA